jgi:hypothetical protein
MYFAIGACVLALLLATTLSGEAAERLATTAYLAGIFAAITLVLVRFFPRPEAREQRGLVPIFPAFLGYFAGIFVLVGAASALASEPVAEGLALAAGFVLLALMVFVRSGTIAALGTALGRGGFIVAASRYVIIAVVAALALAALLGEGSSESIVVFAFRLAVVAAIFVAASLFAPTSAGRWVREHWERSIAALDRMARAFVFERMASYTAIGAVGALIAASVLPQPAAEVFAVTAYLAAAAATFSIAMECRRLRS